MDLAEISKDKHYLCVVSPENYSEQDIRNTMRTLGEQGFSFLIVRAFGGLNGLDIKQISKEDLEMLLYAKTQSQSSEGAGERAPA